VELRRVHIRQIVKAEGLMTIDTLDFFVPVSLPEPPKHKIGSIGCRKKGQSISAAVLTDPFPT